MIEVNDLVEGPTIEVLDRCHRAICGMSQRDEDADETVRRQPEHVSSQILVVTCGQAASDPLICRDDHQLEGCLTEVETVHEDPRLVIDHRLDQGHDMGRAGCERRTLPDLRQPPFLFDIADDDEVPGLAIHARGRQASTFQDPTEGRLRDRFVGEAAYLPARGDGVPRFHMPTLDDRSPIEAPHPSHEHSRDLGAWGFAVMRGRASFAS